MIDRERERELKQKYRLEFHQIILDLKRGKEIKEEPKNFSLWHKDFQIFYLTIKYKCELNRKYIPIKRK